MTLVFLEKKLDYITYKRTNESANQQTNQQQRKILPL